VIPDVTRQVAELAAGSSSIEAVSVLVVPPAGIELDGSVAAQVGPLLARQLYPERFFGAALHVEAGSEPGSFIVDVEALARPLSAVRFNQGAGSSN
jgi:hypothetical protein